MFPFLASIIPTIGVSFLFWLAIRAMLQADRRERLAMARAEVSKPSPDSESSPG